MEPSSVPVTQPWKKLSNVISIPFCWSKLSHRASADSRPGEVHGHQHQVMCSSPHLSSSLLFLPGTTFGQILDPLKFLFFLFHSPRLCLFALLFWETLT